MRWRVRRCRPSRRADAHAAASADASAVRRPPPAALVPGERSASAGCEVSVDDAMRVLCGPAQDEDGDAALLRLTLLRVAAERSVDAQRGSGDRLAAAVCAAALQDDRLCALARLLHASDPVRCARAARLRCCCHVTRLPVPPQCVGFAAAAALRALARSPGAPCARLCELLFRTASAAADSRPAADASPARKRRRQEVAAPPCDAGPAAVAALCLLKTLLKDMSAEDAPAPGAGALRAFLAACIGAAVVSADEARTLHAARLLTACMRRASADNSAEEAAALCAAALEPRCALLLSLLLPPERPSACRHAALALVRAAAPVATTSCTAACAAALAAHATDLLAPPQAEALASAASSSPFTRARCAGVDDDGLRRRALLAAAVLARAAGAAAPGEAAAAAAVVAAARAAAPPPLLAAWAAAASSDASADACAAALVELMHSEDDLLAESLCVATGLAPALAALRCDDAAAAAARLCRPARLLAHACAAVRYDAGVLVDLLLASQSGIHLATFLCAAGRAAATGGADGPAAADARTRACCAALRARVARLCAARLWPYDAKPLLRRLAALASDDVT
jgi:hypothetical protein